MPCVFLVSCRVNTVLLPWYSSHHFPFALKLIQVKFLALVPKTP